MVGDSFEDVEVGNAAGTASCLIAGKVAALMTIAALRLLFVVVMLQPMKQLYMHHPHINGLR